MNRIIRRPLKANVKKQTKSSENLHCSEGGVVTCDCREVVLQHGQGAGQRNMPTAAEQNHARKAEDGGHQRGIGHPAQTLDAALEASCRGRKREGLFPLFLFDLDRRKLKAKKALRRI